MVWESPKDAMPWVGLYAGVASFICTFAMAADAVQAIWQRKLWFPNKFFTLNASTLTLIAIAMKLPVDLTTNTCEGIKASCDAGFYAYRDIMGHAKMSSINFLVTMLANFLPSLGLMDDRELLMNTVALGILIITIAVNIGIQFFTHVLFLFVDTLPIFIFSFLCSISVALTVPTSRKILEHRYKESQQFVTSLDKKRFSSKERRNYVKKYWMMTETRNPQLVIACSPVSSALGVICVYFSLISIIEFLRRNEFNSYGTSDYKWSLKLIFVVQSIGVVVGSIAPASRCFTSIGHYSLSKKWSKNQLNVFRVEKHWIKMLQQWKCNLVNSHIPGRHCKIVFHILKNTSLNLCIALHVAVLVICKTTCLIPRAIMILLSSCWQFFKPFLKRFKKVVNAPSRNVSAEMEEYARYVVQIEEEAKLSQRILRNTLRSITQLLDGSKKKEPHNLLKLLQKSTGFNGVVMFDNDEVPPLYPKENCNCWSLVVVTLTSTTIALPNIPNGHFKGLLASIREGLQIVRHIEEYLNVDGESVKAKKAARRVWTEVEVYRTWLQFELQKKAHKGKTSKEILKWLGDEAAKIVIASKSSKKPSIDQSPYKFILASSMYRISQTILLQCNKQENLSKDEELLEWILTMIADILCACFTNLPRVIKMKCHHHAIEKRGDNIRNAAHLLGKSEKILKILKARQLPNIDSDSMAYIDKWRVLTMGDISNGGNISNGSNNDASTARIQPTSSGSNESLIITIM